MGSDYQVAIVFFDGECNLCNSFVKFVIQRDSRSIFRFAPLQSATAASILKDIPERNELRTVILKKDNKLYYKSNAALEISRNLSGLWPVFYIFKIVPAFIRDFIYDYIATHRYRWFGKTECLIPTPELKARFLE